jgi:hypothetical protein
VTEAPLPPQCQEARRRLAEGDADGLVFAHVAACPGCSAFAAALRDLDARVAALPLPEPPPGAVDRAVARFRAGFPAAPTGWANPAPPPAPWPPIAGPPMAPVTDIGEARQRRWRRSAVVVTAAAAVAALIVGLVVGIGPTGHGQSAGAATLTQAATNTGAQKSARLALSGDIGLSVLGQTVRQAITGSGAAQFPGRGELSESTSSLGGPLQENIVSVGNRTWTRLGGGSWQLQPSPPGQSAIDEALMRPQQALDQLSRAGTDFRNLGPATVDGVTVQRIQLVIPGDDFHAFGNYSQQVSHWTVVVEVGAADLVLRRLIVDGQGTIAVLGSATPFSYHLQLTLSDFGTRVSIQPPP